MNQFTKSCLVIVTGYHGNSGQWKVTVSNRTPEITEAYLQAFQELGHKRLKEINGKEQEGHYHRRLLWKTSSPLTVLL